MSTPIVILPNAQDRVLRIPELLDSILEPLEWADLASCARVCRYWELPSLRVLWADSTPHHRNILRILGDLEVQNGPIRFQAAPGLENWARFHRYASLIKRIRITIQEADSKCHNRLTPRAVHQIRVLAEAKRVPIFPNLVDLILRPVDQSSCEASIFLITDVLLYLGLVWEYGPCLSLLPHLERAQYCRELRQLDIFLEDTIDRTSLDALAQAAARTLGLLTKLEVVSLPNAIIFEQNVWHELRSLPLIREISCSSSATGFQAAFNHLELGQGFEKLVSFECYPSIHEAKRLFAPTSPHMTLTAINVVVDNLTANNSVGPLLSAIPDAFPRMENIAIQFENPEIPLRLCDIKPLFQLSQLTDLHIGTSAVADLSDDEYNALGRSLLGLRKLSISPNPFTYSRPAATLLALSNIAAHCRHIRSIGVFLDVSPDALPGPETLLSAFSESLEHIELGPSAVTDPHEVGIVLSRMLVWCRPTIWPCTPPMGVSEETASQYEAAASAWSRVAVTIQSLQPPFDAIKTSLQALIGELVATIQQRDARIAELEAA